MTTHPETRAVRVGAPEPGSRPVSVPIHQTAIYAFDGPADVGAAMSGPDGAFSYSGYGNPTVRAFEDAMTALEGGAAALATGSGSSATSSVLLAALRTGDHVIAQRALYGGTYAALQDLAANWGVEVTYVEGADPAELADALRPNSRLLLLETIANPTGFVPDLPGLLGVARSAGLTTVVDNTFATPLLCRPIEHGADVVVHSATKYLGGHHDVVGGVAVFADAGRYRETWARATRLGTVADPFSAWLVLRGIKTLALRVRRQCETAGYLAERLAGHPAVTAVHHPGLPSHPSHARAARLLDGYGGTLAFDLAGGLEAAHAFMGGLRLVLNAGSLGGTETVTMHPATTSHRHLDDDALAAAGIGPGTVRIACGIEHPDDLWADISRALR
ncbi:trans-sulfuration enzyme family protein [Saccharothrix syringae]|uniref:homocysteine desulfhydrase n=1 Tax=Saccharothrix syringae TaxID=103733 RepID=A0A5Q0H5P2_SACSY|nr:aminotransferase class I/II-fold pyridoxal phosphate-dependent enzyme [Saccharothrix syringae]QFZ21459.1 aminotransferase class I/II-fold pyridoxal phosphate-dependent enzyme [Saccharothrix syringae]